MIYWGWGFFFNLKKACASFLLFEHRIRIFLPLSLFFWLGISIFVFGLGGFSKMNRDGGHHEQPGQPSPLHLVVDDLTRVDPLIAAA